MKFFLSLFITLLVLNSSWAQVPKKIPIEVQLQADDPVGSMLGYGVKECIRKSRRYEINSGIGTRLQLRLTTLDPNSGIDYMKGKGTAWFAILTLDADSGVEAHKRKPIYNFNKTNLSIFLDTVDLNMPIYIGRWAGVCGRDPIESAAAGLLADIDSKMDYMLKNSDVYRSLLLWREIR
jgi:hypothetical protein